MEERIFVGYQYGTFKADNGDRVEFCSVFVLEDFGEETADYHFKGQKASKYKCVKPDVWAGINIGDKVECFFDSKHRISYMHKIDAKA